MIEAKDMASQLIAGRMEARTAIPPFSDSRFRHRYRQPPMRRNGHSCSPSWTRASKLIGAKLGLTSRAKQEAMNVAEPLYGWITSGMIIEYGGPVDRQQPDPPPRGAGNRVPAGPRRYRTRHR